MSLGQRISAFQAERFPHMDPAVRAVLQDTTDELVRSGIAERSLAIGDPAPDFSLPNARGETVTLAETIARGPAVVTFYRGSWCPYCNLTLRAYQQHLSEMQAMGATLLAISPQTPDNSLSTVEKNELEFEVLSDAGNLVARRYRLVFVLPEPLRSVYREMGIDLAEVNGDTSWELPMPGTFVVDGDAIIRLAFVDAEYRRRLEPTAILETLR